VDQPALTLLTPEDEDADNDDTSSLLIDLGPELPLSDRHARAKTRSPAAPAPHPMLDPLPDGPEPESVTSTSDGSMWWPPVRWPWGMVALALLATVLVVILGLAAGLRTYLRPLSKPDNSTRPRSTHQLAANTSFDQTVGKHEADIVVCTAGLGIKEEPSETPARNLLEAIQIAMGRQGYVELRNREPLCLDAGKIIDLGSGNMKIVDIRAAPGIVPPVIEIQMGAGGPFLGTKSTASLSLSGLEIRVRYPPNPAGANPAPPPLIDAGGPVTIRRCAFQVVGDPPPPNGCLALAVNGREVNVDGCWFEGFDTAIDVQSYAATVAQIRQTMIVPRPRVTERRGWAVELHLAPGGGKPSVARRLVLERCTFEGAGFLGLDPAEVQSSLEIEVKHCAVRAEWLLAWKPLKPEDRFENGFAKQFHWHGEGNQFEIRGRSWIVLSKEGTPALSAGVTDLDSWSKFAVRESDPIRTALIYRTDPAARSDPLLPKDFAIISPNPPGADPKQVGHEGH
jgi:hypothetical protein